MIEEYYKNECPTYENEKDLENWLSKGWGSNMKTLTNYLKTCEDKPNVLNILKIRKVYKTMNFLKAPKYHYDATNIKIFDNEIKIPNNRGLETDRPHIYNDDETNI